MSTANKRPIERALTILLASIGLAGCVVTTSAGHGGGLYYDQPHAYYGPPGHRHRHHRHHHHYRDYAYAPGFFPGRPAYCRPSPFGPRCYYR